MCNGSGCKFEITSGPNWGDCGKKPWQKCPDEMTEQEQIEAAEYADLAAEAKWEQQQEQRNEKRIL